jgi:hypothetical protein
LALPKYYNTGTLSVANGATAVTGVGTAWFGNVKADDVLRRAGFSVRVASVTDDTHLTLAEPWPGTSLVGSAYEIAITYDGPEYQLRARELFDMITRIENTGIGIDAFGNFDERDDFDDEAEDFAFLSLDGDGDTITTAVVFLKASAVSGDWSEAIRVQGETGEQGDPGLIGDWKGPWAPTIAYAVDDAVSFNGSSYIAVTGHTSGSDFVVDLGAGKWEIVAQSGGGPIWRGPWDSGVTYVLNDVVSDDDSGGDPAAWVALTTNLNSRPKDNPTDWDFFPASFPVVDDYGLFSDPVDATADYGDFS